MLRPRAPRSRLQRSCLQRAWAGRLTSTAAPGAQRAREAGDAELLPGVPGQARAAGPAAPLAPPASRPACMHAIAHGTQPLPELAHARCGERAPRMPARRVLARCRSARHTGRGGGPWACGVPVTRRRTRRMPGPAVHGKRSMLGSGHAGRPGAADSLGWVPSRVQEDTRCSRWRTEGAGRRGHTCMQLVQLRHDGRLDGTDYIWGQARERARAVQPQPGRQRSVTTMHAADSARMRGGRGVTVSRPCG